MVTMLLSGLVMGFIFAPLALGVYISYRLLRFADITVDGSFLLGGVVVAALLKEGYGTVTGLLVAQVAGALAGMMTGLLITRFGIRRILAGILVMTALYSINQHILGMTDPRYFFPAEHSLRPLSESIAMALYGSLDAMEFLGGGFLPETVGAAVMYGGATVILSAALLLFFHTRLGLAIRGAGGNETAVRAMGANVSLMIVLALALSNAAAALTGALFALELGSVEVGGGVGMIVTGLASVMIGGALFGRQRFSLQLVSAAAGSVLFAVLISLITLNDRFSEDIKLFTAIFVVLALVVPRWVRRLRGGAESLNARTCAEGED
ncbi:MAG: ABC transporter permease [Bacteroidota bacterium]|jgi:putative ABC transport system permease protein|nr:ABC transporter permease [Bacteroidota bacterium]